VLSRGHHQVITSPGLIGLIPTKMVILFVPHVMVVIVFCRGAKGSAGIPELIYTAIATPLGVIPGTEMSKSESIGVSCVEPQTPTLPLTGDELGWKAMATVLPAVRVLL